MREAFPPSIYYTVKDNEAGTATRTASHSFSRNVARLFFDNPKTVQTILVSLALLIAFRCVKAYIEMLVLLLKSLLCLSH